MSENNKYEVGFTPDDNNDLRLPGTVQPEPVRGDSSYGQGKWAMGKKTELDAGDTAGVVGKAMMLEPDTEALEGSLKISTNSNVDTKNSDTTLMATASEENLSKKYKYPNVHQDVPTKGQPSTQYNDHT